MHVIFIKFFYSVWLSPVWPKSNDAVPPKKVKKNFLSFFTLYDYLQYESSPMTQYHQKKLKKNFLSFFTLYD